MALTADEKTQIINEYATHEGDTGSPEVQVALLSKRIADLTEHLKEHKHDHHSRRGMQLMIGDRRRLLDYLKRVDINRYRSLIERLGLRRLLKTSARVPRMVLGRFTYRQPTATTARGLEDRPVGCRNRKRYARR